MRWLTALALGLLGWACLAALDTPQEPTWASLARAAEHPDRDVAALLRLARRERVALNPQPSETP